MKRHWCINGRFLAQPMTGVQRYATEIVRALDTLLYENAEFSRDLEIELLVPPDAFNMLPLKAIGSAGRQRLSRPPVGTAIASGKRNRRPAQPLQHGPHRNAPAGGMYP